MAPHINLGSLSIPTYSVFIFFALVAFAITTLLLLEVKEKGEARVTNRLLLASLLGFGALGGFAYLFNSLFLSIERGYIVLGGITWLGGVVGALPSMVLFIYLLCPMVRTQVIKHFNLMIPGFALAHGLGRVGCFFAGCCYGKVTDSAFGVCFPAGSYAAKQYPDLVNGGSLPVLPTQLFEAVFEILLFVLMLILYKKLKEHFLEIYCFSYGTFRFLLELLRGDKRGSVGFFLTPSQLLSLVLIGYGVLLIIYRYNKKGLSH